MRTVNPGNTSATPTSPSRTRPLFAALALTGFGLFIAAPTPGNVGGCGGTHANTPIQPGDLTVNPPETPEYLYFDRGLCSHVCTRLIQCRSLCGALSSPPDNCDDSEGFYNDGARLAEAFRRCVRDRGGLRESGMTGSGQSVTIFGLAQCPHACPRGLRPGYALTEWDVQTCGDAVLNLSCEALHASGTIYGAFAYPPTECLSACQP